MNRVTADRFDDFAGGPRETRNAQRKIKFADCPARKLCRQTQMRSIIFRDHKTAARFLVYPVNDTGSQFAADATQRRHLVK
jgi:hypothetical protein